VILKNDSLRKLYIGVNHTYIIKNPVEYKSAHMRQKRHHYFILSMFMKGKETTTKENINQKCTL